MAATRSRRLRRCRQPLRRVRSPRWFTIPLLVVLGSAVGCASYRMGAESLYAPDIHTIYVPMIESNSFRRDMGERLTEAVVNEIETKTPFKVVSTPNADGLLSVRLVADRRNKLVEDAYDAVRAAEYIVSAEVTFVNRRRAGFAPPTPQVLAVPAELLEMGESSLLVPAVGQSVSSAQQEAIERLAQQIVGAMEEPW